MFCLRILLIILLLQTSLQLTQHTTVIENVSNDALGPDVVTVEVEPNISTPTSSDGQKFQKTLQNSYVVLVSALNGELTGINAQNGNIMWKIRSPPLVSQSISQMEFTRDGHVYRIIPSLDGNLFMLDTQANGGLHALPVNAENLFTSSFQLASDALLVGGREQKVYAFNPLDGQVRYNCTREGCKHFPVQSHGPVLLSKRSGNTVRAIDLETGHEKWNFSVGVDQLATLGDVNSSAEYDGDWKITLDERKPSELANDPHEIDWEFNVESGVVMATELGRGSRGIRWATPLGAAISKVWSMRGGRLREVSLFNADERARRSLIHYQQAHQHQLPASALSTYSGGPDKQVLQRGCRSQRMIYLGEFNRQLYVQLEDGLGARAANPVFVALPAHTSDGEVLVRNRHSKSTALTLADGPKRGFYQANYPVVPRNTLTPPWEDIPQFESVIDEHEVAISLFVWWFQFFTFLVSLFMIMHLIVRKKCLRDHHDDFALPIVVCSGGGLPTSSPPTQQDLECSQLQPPPPLATNHLSQLSLVSNSSSATLSSGSTPFESRYQTDYEHLRCLGSGGFGVVFEAKNKLDDCSYAIKRVRVRNSPNAKERLLREVKALANLEHPGIVRYFMAWIERPPDGWQEEHDKQFKLLTEDSPSPDGDEDEFEADDDDDLATTETTDESEASLRRRRSRKKPTAFDESISMWSGLEEGIPEHPAENSASFDIVFEHSTSAASAQPVTENNNESSRPRRLNRRPPFHRGNSVEILFERQSPLSITPANTPEPTSQTSNTSNSPKLLSEVGDTTSEQAPVEVEDGPKRLYLYIQMQLCMRRSLKGWLLSYAAENRPDRPMLLEMFVQIVDAVGYLHRNGLMHRDLKPSNILFDIKNRIRIVDFGLATSLMEKESQIYTTLSSTNGVSASSGDGSKKVGGGNHRHTKEVGTSLYMSPEQRNGSTYDHKVDIYAMGLIFMELMISFGTVMERITTLTDAKNQKLPSDFEKENPSESEFIRWLLSEDASKRPECDDILRSALMSPVWEKMHSLRMRSISSNSRPSSSEEEQE